MLHFVDFIRQRYFGAKGCSLVVRFTDRGLQLSLVAVQLSHLSGLGFKYQSFGLIRIDIGWSSRSFELDHTVR